MPRFNRKLKALRADDETLFDRHPPIAALAERMWHGLDELHRASARTALEPRPATVYVPGVNDRRQGYRRLIDRIRTKVDQLVPVGSIVAVISRGDATLLDLPGCTAWHFPRDGRGSWAGYHPATGADTVEHLTVMRSQGARFLLIPSTCFWWLDFYEALNEHLRSTCTAVVEDDDVALFELPPAAPSSPRSPVARHLACPPPR